MTVLTRREATLGLAATALAGAGMLAARPARAATTHQVRIAGFAFDPAELTIAKGDSVQFTNEDGTPHTATADDGSFDTGALGKGKTATVLFKTAGAVPYHCNFHGSMTATIAVA